MSETHKDRAAGARNASAVLALLTVCLCSPGSARAQSVPAAAGARRVCVQPLGRYDARMIPSVAAGLTFIYGVEVKVLSQKKLPASAYYSPRRRYLSIELLDFLATEMPAECSWTMGFTSVDISTPKGDIKNWGILGQANLGGSVGIVSSFRAKRGVDRRTLILRVVKVAVHEFGHVLGAPHDTEPGCVMNDAEGTVKTVDREEGLLCAASREVIERHSKLTVPVRDKMDWDVILK